MSKQAVRVPDLGGASDVEVIELCVTSGDTVSEGQALIVVESDKASMDVPSSAAGKIVSIEVAEGDAVAEGDIILYVESDTADADDQTQAAVAESVIEKVELQEPARAEPAAPAKRTAATVQDVLVPDTGGAEQVELIEILVAPGDAVQEGDSLVVMESDKASMELPSPAAGTIQAVHVQLGDQLSEGQRIMELLVSSAEGQPAASEASAEAAPEPSSQTSSQAQQAATDAQPPAQKKVAELAGSGAGKAETASASQHSGGVYAGPAVRKLARELGVDLARVTATGPKGRIGKEDLYAYVKKLASDAVSTGATYGAAAAIPKVPEIDFAQFGDIDRQPMTKLHKVTAANMQRSWLNVPHVTQYDDADITDLEAFRKGLKPQMEQRGIKVSPLPFILKAIAAALKEVPAFNVSLGGDGETIIHKKYIHIGMAVDTPAGLMVPVIRDVDKKGIWELSAEVLELAAKARDRKLKPAEMQGGCFTVSSLGNIGGTGFTPIVNTPEVGILGVSKMTVKPVYMGDAFQPRKMLPLSLSYDHRAVNGGDAGRFLTFLVSQLSDVRHLLL